MVSDLWKRVEINSRQWASYQIRKIAGCACPGNAGCSGNAGNVFPALQRKPVVSDPGMYNGTCVTRVPLCMSGSLTRGGGENVPGIPSACATRKFTYLQAGKRPIAPSSDLTKHRRLSIRHPKIFFRPGNHTNVSNDVIIASCARGSCVRWDLDSYDKNDRNGANCHKELSCSLMISNQSLKEPNEIIQQ